MTVSDVVINMLCKKTVILKTERDISHIFSGKGYPHTYGFYRDNFQDSHWMSSFLKPSSSYDVIDRSSAKVGNFADNASGILSDLKYYKFI